MSQIAIDKKSRMRAMKSLTNKYKLKFGECHLNEDLSKNVRYTHREWILKYAENIEFWKSEVPDLVPNMRNFSIAKHAICTNAMSQLWQKCEEMGVRNEVQLQLDANFLKHT